MNRRCCGLLASLLAAGALLGACSKAPPQALGTLEYDRITLPAPAAERIVAVGVRDGERVNAGRLLLRLDPSHTQAMLAADEAQARQQGEVLRELEVGPREEDIAKARADLAAAQANERDARANYDRMRPLAGKGYVSAADLDSARAAAGAADGQVGAMRAALDELLHGSRPEQIAQAKAALASAEAGVAAERVLLGKLDVTAPRTGVVDNIPYKLGDQAPVGAPLAILLVGDAPYARIYVPEPQRANLHVGDRVQVHVDGREQAYAGTVRLLRSEPVFTPYYALTGEDAARLSYIAEITLGKDAASLPAGLPLRVGLPEPSK
ncbi:MAG TPA: HlyD family efflux transporter periplasmic adaptor subunit [Rhodanobacteraceae bacterium]|nr:HlyD family efflux transporter periplasmic adaptor subunit [Rhodanobacteraceae bacterium]